MMKNPVLIPYGTRLLEFFDAGAIPTRYYGRDPCKTTLVSCIKAKGLRGIASPQAFFHLAFTSFY